MHVGETTGPDCVRPLLRFEGGAPDGAMSRDGRIAACYVHGLFNHDAQRAAWLARLGAPSSLLAYDDVVESTLDDLAAHLEQHVDLDRLLSLAR